jgi:hypothetical protein
MTRSRNKTPSEKIFTKRRSVEDGLKLADAAHEAVWRLYCEVFGFWRACSAKKCRRHRRCLGEPAQCLMRGLPSVPPALQLAAAKEVAEGGPRRVPPATHLEFVARREPLAALTSWRGNNRRDDAGEPVSAYETRDYYRKSNDKRMPYDCIA